MYDPLIVDVFVREHMNLISDQAIDGTEQQPGLSAITRATTSTPQHAGHTGLESINASTGEMVALYDMTAALSKPLATDDIGALIAQHLRRIVPASTCVIYLYDTLTDDLVVEHASGEGAAHFRGLRFPRGQRLSGWVAANKQTIVNSDPILDLGEAARAMKVRLQSCLSTPVLMGDDLVGVLTAYSPDRDAFTNEHGRFLELMSGQISQRLNHFRVTDASLTRPSERSVEPSAIRADEVLPIIKPEDLREGLLSVIVVERSRAPSADTVTEEFFDTAGATIRRTLRSVDVCFKYSPDEFVIILPQASLAVAKTAAARIAAALRSLQLDHSVPPESLRIGSSAAPSDGSNLERLIGAARFETGLHGAGPPEQSSAVH